MSLVIRQGLSCLLQKGEGEAKHLVAPSFSYLFILRVKRVSYRSREEPLGHLQAIPAFNVPLGTRNCSTGPLTGRKANPSLSSRCVEPCGSYSPPCPRLSSVLCRCDTLLHFNVLQ